MANIFSSTTRPLHQEREYDKAFAYSREERDEMERMWAMYSGFDHGQWLRTAVAQLKAASRHIAQYNIVRGKVENLAGSIVKNDFDIDFVPVDREVSHITRMLKGIFYSDKEMMDWNIEHLQIVIDGLIHLGVEEMFISDKYNPLGNIGFRRCMPGSVLVDPHWKTHKTEDLKQLWKVAYLKPEEIKRIYKTKSSRIDEMTRQQVFNGETYEDDPASKSIQYAKLEQAYGSLYRVVERHYLKETSETVNVWVGENGTVLIPNKDKEERDAFIEDLKSKGEGRVLSHERTKREYWISTSCAQLDNVELLEDRMAEIQIGRLPFYPWSAARINGRNSGIVALLVDAQQSLNKRESLSDHMIANATHGARFMDEAIVNGDPIQKKNIEQNIDKPNALFWTAPGALQSGRNYTQMLEKTAYQGEIYQEIDRMNVYLDKISGVDETSEGRSTGSEDNALFYARRQAASEIARTVLIEGLAQHWNDKGEGYMQLAGQIYPGSVREFRTNYGVNKGKKETLTLNSGGPELSELRDFPRHKVVISQSPAGITMRTTERAINSEIQNRLPADQYVYQALVSKNIFKTLDQSFEDNQALDVASDIQMTLAVTKASAEIASNKLISAQATLALQQLEQQSQQPQPAVGPEGEQPQEQVQEQQAPVETI